MDSGGVGRAAGGLNTAYPRAYGRGYGASYQGQLHKVVELAFVMWRVGVKMRAD